MKKYIQTFIVLLQKGMQGLLGITTLLFIIKFMDPVQQGYYYAFGSILSFYSVLDLGLSGLIVQLSSKYFLQNKLTHLTDKLECKENILFIEYLHWSFIKFLKKAPYVILLLPIGYIYFNNARLIDRNYSWEIPWILSVLSLTLNFIVMPILSVIEGIGEITEAYMIRLLINCIGCISSLFVIYNNSGLYTFFLNFIISFIFVLLWACLKYGNIAKKILKNKEYKYYNKKSNINLQKKVAITTLSNYIFLNIPILITFYCIDATSAGKLGIAFVIGNLIGSFASSSLISKIPLITNLISINKIQEAKKIFIVNLKISIFFMLILYSIIIIVMYYLNEIYVKKFIDTLQLIFILATFVSFNVMALLSNYFRAFGNDILAKYLFYSTWLSLTVSFISSFYFGVTGMVISLFLIYSTINFFAAVYHWIEIEKIKIFSI